MRYLLICFGAAVILASSATDVRAQRDGAIGSAEVHGQVRYAVGGVPAERVLAPVERYDGGLVGQSLTDNSGAFRFSGLEKAQYTVTVRAAGYRYARQQIDLKTSTNSIP